MGLVSGIVVFVALWWITLYAVLPFGIKQTTDLVKGQETGAPERTHIGRKLLITTLIAFCAWTLVYLIIDADIPFLDKLFMEYED